MRFPEEYGEEAASGTFPTGCPHCGASLGVLPGIEAVRAISVMATTVCPDGRLDPRWSDESGHTVRFACGTCSGRIVAGVAPC